MNIRTTNKNSIEVNSRNASIVAAIFFVAILLNIALSVRLGIQSGEWQHYFRGAMLVIFEGITIYSFYAIRGGNTKNGISWILTGLMAVLFTTSLLFTNLGILLAFTTLALVFVVAYQTFPEKQWIPITKAAFVVAITIFLVDFIPSTFRLPAVPEFQFPLQVLAGGVLLANILLAINISRSNLTSRYIFGLSIVAILSIMAFFVLSTTISRQESDAAVINAAGRQRMLSQRISRFAILYAISKTPIEQADFRQVIIEDLALFEASHNALINGGSVSGFKGSEIIILPGNPSAEVREIYFNAPYNLDQQVVKFIADANALLNMPPNELTIKNPYLQNLINASASELITPLNYVVDQYQNESNQAVNRLQFLEIGVLSITLTALVLVALFVFRPMMQEITNRTEELQKNFLVVQQKNRDIESQSLALTTSAEVSRRISTILDEKQLVSEVVNQVKNAFNYYHTHIYLLNEVSGELIMAGGTGQVGQILLTRGHKIPKDKGLVGRAASMNTSILVRDTSKDPNWLPNQLLPDTKSEIAVPISIGDQVLGVLDVQHDLTDGLKNTDVGLLQSIANQVAVAVQNARLYAKVKQQAEYETHLSTISQKIQLTTTIESAMQVMVRELGNVLGSKETRVFLNASAEKGQID